MLSRCKFHHLVLLVRLNSKCYFLKQEFKFYIHCLAAPLRDPAKYIMRNHVSKEDPRYNTQLHVILNWFHELTYLSTPSHPLFLLKNHMREKFQKKCLKRKKHHLLKVCNWNYLNRSEHHHHYHGLFGKSVQITSSIQ